VTGDVLLQLLERRLDNIAYRLGFATSRAEARQLVRHGHLTVNDRKVDVPSYLVRVGDVVAVRERSRRIARIAESLAVAQRRGVPDWLEVDAEAFKGTVKALPMRADLTMPINEKLVVELYSK
jgi:small subunit ribosomal protein S4